MIHIAHAWRVFAGGIATGFTGIVIITTGKASADPAFPLPPPPSPAPVQIPAQPAQILTAVPGEVNNRLNPIPPPAPAPIASLVPATAPAVVSPLPPTVAPATSGTLRDYLEAKGVKLEPQRAREFNALDITLPMPPRWTQVPDPNVPDAFVVIADRVGGNSVYTSNAQVVVYKLIGNFDPAEAITHGYLDSQQLLAWQTTNASISNSGGFPSSIIEGTYRENDMTLNTSRRHVIAPAGADKYLVSLSVTTAASQAVADAPATDVIVNGFRVTTLDTTTPTPTQLTAPAPIQVPRPATVELSEQAPLPRQAPALQPPSNLLTLVPGIPPLPNLHLTSQR